MYKTTAEVVTAEDAVVRLAVALADAAKNAHALAHACPEASAELRRASLSLVHAARDVTAAADVITGGKGKVH